MLHILKLLNRRRNLVKELTYCRSVEDGVEIYIDTKVNDPFEIQDLLPEGNPTGWCFRRYYAIACTSNDKWSVIQIDSQSSDFDHDPDYTKHYTGSSTFCQAYQYVHSKTMAKAIAATLNDMITLDIIH